MDNYIGKMLDNRYEILEVIGIGGMAVVYKARCHRLNRLVAVKILKDEFSQDAEFRRRFHAESQAVAMLSHPNIVSVYDVSHSGDTDYIVMELIDGITLKQYMEQKGQLNWRETLHFSTQIAKALEHAHSRGIIHRDIKPHNIMILKDGSVKVADFGIARITSAQSTLTREALGSVHYISPEQARGSRVDKRTDIYSLGVVMYEMLTGRPPFDGDSPVAVAIQHINGTPILPTELNSSIPKGLEQITMHEMTAALDKRYESATDVLSDLEEFRKNPNVVFDFSSGESSVPAQDPLSASAVHPKPVSERAASRPPQAERAPERQEEPPRRGSRVAVIAGIVCIVLAVCGIGYFLYHTFLRDVFSTTEDIQVPNFIGLNYENISPDDEKYKDFVLTPKWVSNEAAYGTIINQDPVEGSLVKPGASVTLQVSQGIEEDTPIPMPKLVGQTVENAKRILTDMNFTAQVIRDYNDEVEKDRVISTDPAAGDPLQPGQVIILTVSDGPAEETTIVPALVGMKIEEALKALEKAELEQGPLNYDNDELPEGTVIFQSIEQDREVRKGTIINLVVSLGPEEDPDSPDDPDSDDDNPDDPGPQDPSDDEPVVPSQSTATVTVRLPTDRDTTVMTVRVDGVPQGEPVEVDTSRGSIEIQVTGTGNQTVDIYFDGVLSESVPVQFGDGT